MKVIFLIVALLLQHADSFSPSIHSQKRPLTYLAMGGGPTINDKVSLERSETSLALRCVVVPTTCSHRFLPLRSFRISKARLSFRLISTFTSTLETAVSVPFVRMTIVAIRTTLISHLNVHGLNIFPAGGVVFMHPGDFTPVCTTELGKAANLQDQFDSRDVKLVGFSCNDAASHKEWIKDIKSHTGGDIKFPMFCDPDRVYAKELGILDKADDKGGLPMTVRSLFVIKPDKTIALMITYPASTGRNFHEILRVVDSVQLTAKNAVATPVDWKRGGNFRKKCTVWRPRRPLSHTLYHYFWLAEDVIVNFPLSDKEADEKFDSYKVIKLPSEEGKDLEKHYLRYTKDPSGHNMFRRIFSKLPFVGA